MERRASVAVVGSYITDLMCRVLHMPSRGETVLGHAFRMGPGGKGANQAVAAARAGARVCFVTKLGRDFFANLAVENLQKEGISTEYVSFAENQHTGAALIIVEESGENMIAVAIGANASLHPSEVDRAESAIARSDILLLQLECSMEANEQAIRIARRHGVRVILNPAPGRPLPAELLRQIDILTPNETEAQAISGIPVTGPESARDAAVSLIAMGTKTVIVTLGKAGAFVASKDISCLVPTPQVSAVDTTGAGDAFNGALATALAEGQDLLEAVRFANHAAALSVTRVGTAPAMPSRREIDEFLHKGQDITIETVLVQEGD